MPEQWSNTVCHYSKVPLLRHRIVAMALKSYRPLTPTLRFKSLPAFDEITKARPAKSLLEPKKKTGGRNHFGRLTSRHIGGGHKHHYRKVDF